MLITTISSAATNNQTGEGVAIKKVTNVFSKKILAKRALREIKLLQHFRGHRNVGPLSLASGVEELSRHQMHGHDWTDGLTGRQITCLYDMDIPRPDNFNETYLYEGRLLQRRFRNAPN